MFRGIHLSDLPWLRVIKGSLVFRFDGAKGHEYWNMAKIDPISSIEKIPTQIPFKTIVHVIFFPFHSAKFEGQTKSGECSDFNPYFGTDTGICAIIKPQLNFDPSLDNLPFWRKLFSKTKEVQRGSEVGKANGYDKVFQFAPFTIHLHADLYISK